MVIGVSWACVSEGVAFERLEDVLRAGGRQCSHGEVSGRDGDRDRAGGVSGGDVR